MSPQITGRYSLGRAISGPQIKAARKPSSWKVHRRVLLKRQESAEALEFGIGQWLWFHGMTLLVVVNSTLLMRVTASSSRRGEQFLPWLD